MAPLFGSTDASIALELQRWPRPPVSASSSCTLLHRNWPVYYDHYDWLDEIAQQYAFADAGEVLRHLLFVANGESAQMKKLIFLIIRCLHCHSGARAGHIPKKEKRLAVFDFQMQWLTAVKARSSHPTVEKTVRVLCDYYRKLTSESPVTEAQLFWTNRQDVRRRRTAMPSGR